MARAGAVLVVVLTAGCSDGGGSAGLPEYTGAPGTSAPSSPTVSVTAGTSAEPTSSPTANVTYRPGDPMGMGAWAVLGRVNVRSPQERAVVTAYLRMGNVGLQAFNTHVVDGAALTSVLQGKRLTQVRQGIRWRIDHRLWTVDRSVLNVLSVRIKGSTATLRVCNFDGTREVDATSRIVAQAPGSTGAYVTMIRRDGVWRGADGRKDPARCDARALMTKTP